MSSSTKSGLNVSAASTPPVRRGRCEFRYQSDCQQFRESRGRVQVVIDDEDTANCLSPIPRRDGRIRCSVRFRRFGDDRQAHHEFTAVTDAVAMDFDGAAVQFH